jgi:hypothetical protein
VVFNTSTLAHQGRWGAFTLSGQKNSAPEYCSGGTQPINGLLIVQMPQHMRAAMPYDMRNAIIFGAVFGFVFAGGIF